MELIGKDTRMEIGIRKCGITVLKRGKFSRADGIVVGKVAGGETIERVLSFGLKCLFVLQLGMFKKRKKSRVWIKKWKSIEFWFKVLICIATWHVKRKEKKKVGYG